MVHIYIYFKLVLVWGGRGREEKKISTFHWTLFSFTYQKWHLIANAIVIIFYDPIDISIKEHLNFYETELEQFSPPLGIDIQTHASTSIYTLMLYNKVSY